MSDATGSAIRGAQPEPADPGRAIQRAAETEEAGEFVLPVLPPGRRRVRVEAKRFTPLMCGGVEADNRHRASDRKPSTARVSRR